MYLEDATSLRMSEIGYQSKAQKNLDIKYNSLDSFLKEIKKAITIPFSEFSNKGLKDSQGDYQQISDGIIQIENEYYDSIRLNALLTIIIGHLICSIISVSNI